MEKTDRQKVRELLEHSINGQTPEVISDRLSSRENRISKSEVVNHIDHIRKSLRNEDKNLMVNPPSCVECGYDDFDDLLNVPSKCPANNCYSRRISEPRYIIQN